MLMSNVLIVMEIHHYIKLVGKFIRMSITNFVSSINIPGMPNDLLVIIISGCYLDT